MFSTDFFFRQQENLVDNQIRQAGFRPLCNKILNLYYCHAMTYFGGKLFWKLQGPIQPLCTGWQVESTFIPRSITTLAFAFKASSSQ